MASLERGAPLCLVHVLTQRKKDGCQLVFFTYFDIFSKVFFLSILGQNSYRAVSAHEKIGQKYQRLKNIANIIVQYKGIVQCFLAQQLGQQSLE